jgi:hypothetical protein
VGKLKAKEKKVQRAANGQLTDNESGERKKKERQAGGQAGRKTVPDKNRK